MNTIAFSSWRDQAVIAEPRRARDQARADFPKARDAAMQADAALAVADEQRRAVKIRKLTGKATDADLKKAIAAHEAAEGDAAIASERRDDVEAMIAAIEQDLPQFEEQAKGQAFAEQKKAYFAECAAVYAAASALATAAARAKAWRDHLEGDYFGTPAADAKGSAIRDHGGRQMLDEHGEPMFMNDGPAPRTRLPGTCSSILGLGELFAKAVEPHRLENFRTIAKQHGLKLVDAK